jgi:hypothetical protein
LPGEVVMRGSSSICVLFTLVGYKGVAPVGALAMLQKKINKPQHAIYVMKWKIPTLKGHFRSNHS